MPGALALCLAGLGLAAGLRLDEDPSKYPFFVEKALLDPRCSFSGKPPCGPPRVIVWGQNKKSFSDVQLLSCGSSRHGEGRMKWIGHYQGPLKKGYPFQFICFFDQLNASSSLNLGTLFVRALRKESKQVTTASGLPIERVFLSPGSSTGQGLPAPDSTVGSCLGIMFGHPRYLEHWVQHQRAIGVNGMHLYTYADESGISPEARQALAGQRDVELVDWPRPSWKRKLRYSNYNAQDNALSHCIIHNAPRYRWVLASDTDEFLRLPPGVRSVQDFVYGDRSTLAKLDTLSIERHAFAGKPQGESQPCSAEKVQVLGKSINNAATLVRMNPHGPSVVFAGPSLTVGGPRDVRTARISKEAMQFAHYAKGPKGCDDHDWPDSDQTYNLVSLGGGAPPSSEDQQDPEDCVVAYANRLERVSSGLGNRTYQLWAEAKERPVAVDESAGVIDLAIGRTPGASAVHSLRPLNASGRQLNLLGVSTKTFDTFAWGVESTSQACRQAVQEAGLRSPGGLEAAMLGGPVAQRLWKTLASHPNADFVMSEGPTASGPERGLQLMAKEQHLDVVELSRVCGDGVAGYSLEQQGRLKQAYNEMVYCLLPGIHAPGAEAARVHSGITGLVSEGGLSL